jgi:hypothetical protein
MKNDKTLKTNTTIVSKIRRALRDMQNGQDAIFTYEREFRA